jgi:hypothetical protein
MGRNPSSQSLVKSLLADLRKNAMSKVLLHDSSQLRDLTIVQ